MNAADDTACKLIDLADHMQSVAAEMFDIAEDDRSLIYRNAIEIQLAADICREWAANVSTSMTNYKIPAGMFCRCNDSNCYQREACLRWLARHQGAGLAGFVSETTLRPGWLDPQQPCRYFVESE